MESTYILLPADTRSLQEYPEIITALIRGYSTDKPTTVSNAIVVEEESMSGDDMTGVDFEHLYTVAGIMYDVLQITLRGPTIKKMLLDHHVDYAYSLDNNTMVVLRKITKDNI